VILCLDWLRSEGDVDVASALEDTACRSTSTWLEAFECRAYADCGFFDDEIIGIEVMIVFCVCYCTLESLTD
jgi:hypothetical protein